MSPIAGILRILSVWLFWPGVALIVWGELRPTPPELGPEFNWDKLQHFTAYFGLASMATMALRQRDRLFVVLDIILLSRLLEFVQAVFGRDADIWDFAANSTGAICGFGVAMLVWRQAGALD